MKPSDVTAAAELLKKRKSLVYANKNTGPDYVYQLTSAYKSAGTNSVCYLTSAEVKDVTRDLIDVIDCALEMLGVEVPNE